MRSIMIIAGGLLLLGILLSVGRRVGSADMASMVTAVVAAFVW